MPFYRPMAFNAFIGRSREWLESELRKAQADFAAGKTIVSAGGGDVNVGHQVSASPEVRIKQLLRALNLIDPTSYPSQDVVPVDRTRPDFSFGRDF